MVIETELESRSERPAEVREVRRTTCVMDCPDACTLEVAVGDGGRVERIGGGRDHPLTAGFICSKVSRFDRRLDHPGRLLYPQRRSGAKGEGRFERISWPEAVAEIAGRFREIAERWGGEAILPYHYGGSNGLLADDLLDRELFARLGALRLGKTICAATTGAVAEGMYGRMPGVAYEDYAEARFILVWGANPKVSSIHLVPWLKEARRRGAFLVAVDPRRNFSAGEVDLHLPVYPGADLPLALGLIRVWRHGGQLDRAFLEERTRGVEVLLDRAEAWPVERAATAAGVATRDLELLAERYAAASPAVLRCGWGLERNRNGGQAVAAILAMPALLGKLGVRGGGFTMSNSAAGRLERERLFAATPWQTRSVNMNRLGEELTRGDEPRVRGLFVYNSNPAVTAPDQNAVLAGLAREDLFTVVSEQVMTDTARFADILLPATTFLEQDEILRAYGSYTVGGVRPVVEPRGEAKPNHEMFALLARAFGWRDGPFAWEPQTVLERVAESLTLYGRKADLAALRAGRSQRYDFPGPSPVQMETVRPATPDGRIDLAPAVLGDRPYEYRPVADERFPLALISPASPRTISSTLGELDTGELTATVHPEDAAARGVETGAWVRVFNSLGEVLCRARIDGRIRPGVVEIPKGAWRKSSGNGSTATALCPADVSEVGGGACFYDARVELEPVAGTR